MRDVDKAQCFEIGATCWYTKSAQNATLQEDVETLTEKALPQGNPLV